jgi:hypothetical protein
MRVREVGVTKAAMPVLTMCALAVLAGGLHCAGRVVVHDYDDHGNHRSTAGIGSHAFGGRDHVQFGAHPGGRGWSGALYRQ